MQHLTFRSRFPHRVIALLLPTCLMLMLATAFAFASPKDMLAAGRVDEAIQTLQQAVDRSPADANSYNLLCRAHFMLEEWDRGIGECERARNLDPQNSLYHLWLGRIYGEKADRAGVFSAAGLVKKVRTSFERAVELNPQDWEARADLAEFYLEAPGIVGGGRDKAVAQADALSQSSPGMSHWIRARVAAKSKDAAGAEREYRAALAANSAIGRAWVDLAILFRNNNRWDEMEQALRNLESAPVERHEALMDGASILLRADRDTALAIRLLHRYLSSPVEEGPAFKAHDMLGHLLEKQGDRAAAADEYRAALALAHNYARARDDLKRLQP